MMPKIGTQIQIEWPYSDGKRRWRNGEIIDHRKAKKRCLIKFEDGDQRWSRMKKDCWRIRKPEVKTPKRNSGSRRHQETKTTAESPILTACELAESFKINLAPLPAPLPDNEEDRINILRELNVLDTLPEAHFDKIVTIAQQVSDCPIVYIAMVDSDRIWFKASIGVKKSQGPRVTSFCAHAILIDPSESMLYVKNATEDPRFAGNDKVLCAPCLRFYCGFPLQVEGLRMGTLCVIDKKPRTLSKSQTDKLKHLARIVSLYLSLRLVMQRLIKVDLSS